MSNEYPVWFNRQAQDLSNEVPAWALEGWWRGHAYNDEYLDAAIYHRAWELRSSWTSRLL